MTSVLFSFSTCTPVPKIWRVNREISIPPMLRNLFTALSHTRGLSLRQLPEEFFDLQVVPKRSSFSSLHPCSLTGPSRYPMHFYDLFILFQLDDGLQTYNRRGAPGPGSDTYQALRNLGAISQLSLLQGFDTAWFAGVVHSEWKDNLVFPLLKHDKVRFVILLASYISYISYALRGKAARAPCFVSPIMVSGKLRPASS